MMAAPSVPKVDEWNLIQKLNYEKDCVGIYLSGHPLDDFKVELSYANTTLDKVQDMKNQRVKVAAFVSSVSHRVSRKGTGFGSFVIQDYKGSQEFALFNEDYARFSPILQPGVSVLIEGEMKQKWNSEEFELKIKEVKQLASLGNSMAESITIMIPIEVITEGLIKDLESMCVKYKGKHKLKTQLIDATNRQTLHLFSTEKKVNVDSDLIAAVEAKGLSYMLN